MKDPRETVDEPGRERAARMAPESASTSIGRYRVERVLGKGSFGLVYLAQDDQLQRPVAIKVPHPERVAQPEDAEAYLTEARTVANLDHPHIVPVYDVGSTKQFPCFVVSKYIDGTDLATRLKQSRLSIDEAVGLVVTVAEALHHAHKQGLVHRDIKPGNILLDRSGKPFVGDFGLALREQDVGRGPRYAGTPAYMSPEQARGEGHRVDGRSDIFGLGVVFYELLTGRRPFNADSREELLAEIMNREVRPPRQWADTIPKELERICLKALSKRASERYNTAQDLGDDLRQFLARASALEKSAVTGPVRPEPEAGTPLPSPVLTPSDQQAVRIVPKGLRAFDATDADFFLELLPGPRDRDGLPDAIRFWKTRIETADADSTFAVVLIYGPSGCGKSSLVKAGLLPRLATSVATVYVEATGDDTEARLLRSLRRHVPDLPGQLGLIESLAALRQGRYLDPGQKLLLVLDQFEQWLHTRRNEENSELIQALRQCDGGRLQAIVLVRDDFWLAVSRFMQALEIRIVEGDNSRLVDLFDPRHARKVLAAFGRAFGALSEKELTKEQDAFLDQAVAGLAQDGKVISVRLALFAEMVKGRPWTPTTFKEVGGTEGIGVTFLEETFAATTAPPPHRLHQKAAQAVLSALLPETGTDIKGHMRSQQDLLSASGYVGRPKDFDDLLLILDGEVRLITPTDPKGIGNDGDSVVRPRTGQKYYQLTHDYLVHSLRGWLTRKQRETRRGRAELRLAERAAAWNGKPENRHLPAWWEWTLIRLYTRPRDWTAPQRRMMRRAGSYHAVRGGLLGLAVVVLTLAGWWTFGTLEAHARVDNLLTAKTTDVLDITHGLQGYRRWANPLLREALAAAQRDGNQRRQLHASLALLPVDAGQADYLCNRLLQGDLEEVLIIRQALLEQPPPPTDRLWALLENRANDPDQRFHAACALAAFDPDNPRWEKSGDDVAEKLAALEPFEIPRWTEMLKPVRQALQPQLATFLEDEKRSPAERRLIANIYGSYAADGPDAYAHLEKRLADLSAADAPAEKKLEWTKKLVNIGVALLVMDRGDKVWPLLRHGPVPTLRSLLIERLGQGGVDARLVLARLEAEEDPSIRRALLLSLGAYRLDRLPLSERQKLVSRMLERYRTDPDPGIHGAARWLLQQWQTETQIQEIDQASRVASTAGVLMSRAASAAGAPRGWSVNGQGQTIVLIPKPREGWFWMGEGVAGHRQPLSHDFALSSKAVTVEQFQRFRAAYKPTAEYVPTKDCPAIEVSWYDAAAYCNWVSQCEGIAEAQRCYEPNQAGEYAEGMKIKAGYLKLRGYRLPTEAEWEYACRAGSTVSYSFGELEELLEKYGRSNRNSFGRAHPCGKLKPNDLGLFDMHGNVWQWAQDLYSDMPVDKEDGGSELVGGASNRVARGGCWNSFAGDCRAAIRSSDTPVSRHGDLGFRIARVPVGASGK
jgi:serine/threonine protein kinase/formylglycine-generating enzyme required for sulfatase activity